MVAPEALPSRSPAVADRLRMPAIVLLVCTALIAIGTISKSWITVGREASSGLAELHIGLDGIEVCAESGCDAIDADRLPLPSDLRVFRWIGLTGGAVSAIAAALFGSTLLARKRDRMPPVVVGQLAFAIAGLGMGYFTARGLRVGHDASIGWSVVVGVGGLIAASYTLRRVGRLLVALPPPPPPAVAIAPQSLRERP
jgi:hypothetical protein